MRNVSIVKISLIVPVYNVAAYLRACLESVLAAQAQVKSKSVKCKSIEVEIICVDDGSTDGSGEILEEWARDAELSSRAPYQVRVIHQQNQGVSAARNAGIEAATGEWIAFVDADDVLHPGALAEWARMIRDNPTADIVSFGLCMFQDGNEIKWNENLFFVDDNSCRPFCISCYRRTHVGKTRFPRLKIGEDGVFWGRMYGKFGQLVTSPFVGYAYRLHGTSAFHSKLTLRKALDSIYHRYLRFFTVWRHPLHYSRAMHRRFLSGVTLGVIRDLKAVFVRKKAI